MTLPICADPNCPNRCRVEELEAEVARLRAELASRPEPRRVLTVRPNRVEPVAGVESRGSEEKVDG